MKILITGGTGYVGSHVALLLKKGGHDVSVVARGPERGSSSAERVRQLRGVGVEVVLADLSVPGQLLSRVGQSGVQVIVHAVSNFLEPRGSESLTLRSMGEVIFFAQACPSLLLFVDLSNNMPYGDTRASDYGANENFVCRPNTVHGANKLEAEEILRKSNLPWTILRISQIYGGVGSSFDWIILDQIRRGKLPLPGNGQNRVGLVHIDDVCQAVSLSIEKRIIGGVLNVCSGDASLTQAALFGFLADCLRVKRPPQIPYSIALAYAFVAERLATMRGQEAEVVPDMVRIMAMDRVLSVGKAQSQLGYQPAYPDSLVGLEEAYAEVFSGRVNPFVPVGGLRAVRGNV